jgi:hypothetical protein
VYSVWEEICGGGNSFKSHKWGYKQRTGKVHPSKDVCTIAIFVQIMKPEHHKHIHQNYVRVVDPDIYFIEREELGDEIEDEIGRDQ